MAIMPENRVWFDRMTPEKQAAFLRSEQERAEGLAQYLAEIAAYRKRRIVEDLTNG